MDALIDLLSLHRPVLVGVAAVLGMIVGSFLNVVVHRLPLMMRMAWRRECQQFLELPPEKADAEVRYDLWTPGSRCPHCDAPIRFWQNIPVLSYALLRGRCADCRQPISLRYPLVELLTGLAFVMVAWRLGPSWQGLGGLLLTAALIALAFIDWDHLLLPDHITLPMLWLGLLVNAQGLFCSLEAALYGAVAGYLGLWTVHRLFLYLTGREGMGYGDFKLLAMLGAWLGWSALPLIILFSSLSGAVIGSLVLVVRGWDLRTQIPFGPYLALAGWIALLWGGTIGTAYRQWAGWGA
jgi:leader peptidase (prepilin peptidase)/N-methyltransferase